MLQSLLFQCSLTFVANDTYIYLSKGHIYFINGKMTSSILVTTYLKKFMLNKDY